METGRSAEALRFGGALWRFWQFRGHLREGVQRVQRALDAPGARDLPRERERALEASGGLHYWLGQMQTTMASYSEAVALARASGDPLRISNALYNMSFLPIWTQDGRALAERWPEVQPLVDEALALARQVGDRLAIARCLWQRANTIFYIRGDVAPSLAALEEAIPIFRESGESFSLAWALHGEGLARLRTGELARARAAFEEQVTLLGEARDPSGVAIALSDLAQLAMAEGDRARAVRLGGASAALRRLTGADLVERVNAVEGRVLDATPADEAPWNEGLAMTLDQAVAYALRREAPAGAV